RILFENLDDIGLEELPDVAHELRTLRRILDLNRRFARATDEDALLDAFLDGALALSSAERAFLLGPGEGDSTSVLRSRDRAGQRLADARCAAGPVARRVLAGGRAEVVEDLARETGASGVRSVVCVPLQSERRLALWLDSEREEGVFASADADLLTAYAEQAALAWERVRLLAQNQRQRDELAATAAEMRTLNDRLAQTLERGTAEPRDARAGLA